MRSFFLVLMAAGSLVSVAQWLMYKTAFPLFSSRWWIIFLALPIIVFGLVNGYMHLLPRSIIRALAWGSGLYLGFFYYSVILLFFFLVASLVGRLFGFPLLAQWVVKGGLALICCLVLAGAYNAVHPVVRQEKFTTAKSLNRPLKIAFVSDLHLGVLFGRDYSREMVERVKALKPDLILLGGDILDNELLFVQQEGSLEEFKKLKAPLGIYAVYGNHDVMRGTGEQEGEYLNSLGIKVVCNEAIDITPNITLTGLDDFMRSHNSYNFPQAEATKLAIFMEHQPRSILKAAKAKYDLYFAGHTHAGQFYPTRELTKRMYALDYGSKFFQEMFATVSNGYGLWGIPLRVGPAPEIVLVQVESKR